MPPARPCRPHRDAVTQLSVAQARNGSGARIAHCRSPAPNGATRMKDIDEIFARLSKSAFRRRFRLGTSDRTYLARKGLPAVLAHARGFIATRLAAANPANDGKQTPFRGHPVFIAQHATATCCRGCLAKWHGIAAGHELTEAERAHVLRVLERWLHAEIGLGL